MTTQPTPDMQELEDKLARAVAESRQELAHRNTVKTLLAEPTLPIPLDLPRPYRDVVLQARGLRDCRWCFGSALNLENYQCLEPCQHCNGTGIERKAPNPPFTANPERQHIRMSGGVYWELFNLTMELRAFCKARGFDYDLHKRDMVQRVSDSSPQGLASKWQNLTDAEGMRLAEMIKQFMAE